MVTVLAMIVIGVLVLIVVIVASSYFEVRSFILLVVASYFEVVVQKQMARRPSSPQEGLCVCLDICLLNKVSWSRIAKF